MSRSFIPSLLLACCSFTAIAQSPILTAATINPIRGDRFIINNCDTSGVTPGPSGTGQVWDFSWLNITGSDTVSADPTVWTPHAALFPSANIALVPITMSSTSVSIYDIATTTKFSQDGVYYNSSSQYATYTDPMDLLQYPFEYNSSFTDSYAGSVLFFGTIPAAESGSAFVQADAWGALTLPGLTSSSAPVTYTSTLRVHSTQTYTDHANLFGLDTIVHYSLESYTWYSPGYHNALLTIATGTPTGSSAGIASFKTVTYSAFEDSTHEAVVAVKTGASLAIFPNPSNGIINIQYHTETAGQVRISLIDVLGREVSVISDRSTTGDQHVSYTTANIAKGLYFIRFQSAEQTITRKIEVQ